MSVQKAIFPGLILGVVFLLAAASALRGAGAAQESGAVDLKIAGIADPSAPQDGTCSISSAYPDAVRQWCGLIEYYAAENGLDVNLVAAVILRESSGQPDAYSKSGAVGLMQVMPRDGLAARFQCGGQACFADRPTMKALFDPEYNVAYGCHMLAELIQSNGSVREALKDYGPMDVGYAYADLVLGTFQQYE